MRRGEKRKSKLVDSEKGVLKVSAEEIEALFLNERNEEQRHILMRFFKTGKGQYGEGDEFLGLKVPQTRAIVKELKLEVAFEEIEKLLYSTWHEVRLCGFLLLVEEMKANLPKKSDYPKKPEYTVEKGLSKKLECQGVAVNKQREKEEIHTALSVCERKALRRKEIADFYLKHARQANNWDLVDLSCEFIVGPYLRLSEPFDNGVLLALADSDNLWEQRIAVVTTLDFIRNGIYEPTLAIINKLISHPHDLIHKAMGWVLREIGKRDKDVLVSFLEENVSRLPRTTLRYAIERLPENERREWLRK